MADSHALRHEPWFYELELDEEGWAPVDQLLGALRGKGSEWESADRCLLERMLIGAAKQRHDLDGDRIRALCGYSVAVRIQKLRAALPAGALSRNRPADLGRQRARGV